MAEKPEFQLYNAITKKKEVFVPRVPGKVGMYVCGVTACDLSHMGHARAYVAFDVLYRYLKHLGYEVVYVRNFTDIDDKIINRVNDLGKDPICLGCEVCDEFLHDMVDLQCLPPTHEPHVSDHMDQIRNMIAQIIINGFAYTVEGDVYFSVDNAPNYGCLSGQNMEGNRAGKRVAVDPRRRNPADFALWKAAKPGEPSWDSPWGPGRPGWHIECSAMSAHYLTHSFDVHGGGEDLIFPLHENEIAQSCAACPDNKISYWIHNGHLNLDGEKMSKSPGNFFTIREVTKVYHPLSLRQLELVPAMILKKQQKQQQLSLVQSLIELEKEIKKLLDVLGLLSSSTFSEVLQQLKDKALIRADLSEDDVLHLIEERALARKNRDFCRSDEIRSDLAAKGIALMDVGKETIWRPCVQVGQEQPTAPVVQGQPSETVQPGQPCMSDQQEQRAQPKPT